MVSSGEQNGVGRVRKHEEEMVPTLDQSLDTGVGMREIETCDLCVWLRNAILGGVNAMMVPGWAEESWEIERTSREELMLAAGAWQC